MKIQTPVKDAGGLILVAGRDPSSRQRVVGTLVDDGHEVVEVAEVASARMRLARPGIDLVVIGCGDNGNSNGDGHDVHAHEVVSDVRRSTFGSSVPIVLVATPGDVRARVRALEAGADDYIVEPFEPAELAARVRSRLRQSDALRVLVDRRSRERLVLQSIVQEASRAANLRAAVEAVCLGLRTLPDVAGAAIVGFMPAGAEVLGSVGVPTMRAGDVVGPQLTEHLVHAATNGPWIAGAEREGDCPGMWSSAVACAPIGGQSAAGILLLDTGVAGAPARAATEILSTAIDAASLADALLDRLLDDHQQRVAGRASIQSLLTRRAFATWFQPIVELSTGRGIGVEALTRFDDGTPPDVRFLQAAALDLGRDLELAALQRALDSAYDVPDDNFVSINLSPETVLDSPDLPDVLSRSTHDVVIELSEHTAVEDYDALRDALVPCTKVARLSVDDAGSGFASLHHILQLHPQYVKLDRSWVHGVDLDPARQALIAGLGHFAQRTGALLVAEGIELEAEHDMLLDLGVQLGQGYLLGRPAPPPAACA